MGIDLFHQARKYVWSCDFRDLSAQLIISSPIRNSIHIGENVLILEINFHILIILLKKQGND